MFAPTAGEVLAGKYRVEKVLGHGGMGMVVAARHLQLDEPVAIKFLLPGLNAQPDQVQRFLREGRAAVKIKSEHVARVIDVATLDDGTPYMVMEILDGCDLAELLKKEGPVHFGDAIEYVLQAGEALAEAHGLGIVHRDLKPANLFLTTRRDGTPCVKVLDFGVSKLRDGMAGAALTDTNGMIGSPLYMSPEQLNKPKDVDARSDVWALGVILFELVSGVRPFDAEGIPQLVMRVLTEPPTQLRTVCAETPPPLLEEVLDKCFQKNPNDRYASVHALAQALAPIAPPEALPSIERIAHVVAEKPVARRPRSTNRNPAISSSGVSSGGGSSSGDQPMPTTGSGSKPKAADVSMDETLPSDHPMPRPVVARADRGSTTTGASSLNANVARTGGGEGSPSSSRKWMPLAAIAILAIGATALWLRGRSDTARDDHPATTASTSTTPAAITASTTTAAIASTAPAPTTPPAVVDSGAPSVSNSTPTPTVAPKTTAIGKPTTQPAVSAKPSASAAAVPSVKPNCTPPYSIDADGKKHYKMECL